MAEEISVGNSIPGDDDPVRLYPQSEAPILVAGQALATWVDVFGLPIPKALSSGVTRDLDFFGSRSDAHEHYRVLSDRGFEAKLFLPSFGDVTPNTAKIVVYSKGGEIAAEIDYLGSLCGYSLEDDARLSQRSITIEFDGHSARLRVMHPFDCLKSRIHNVTTLTAKQNAKGVAQAQLAIAVVRTYFEKIFSTPDADLRALLYPLVEAVIELSASQAGVRAFLEYGLDVLEAIPHELFPEIFRERRWPRALRYVERRRAGRNGQRTSRVSPFAVTAAK